MEELWRQVRDCEGRYEVSSLGRIRSVVRKAVNARGHNCVYGGKILTPILQHKGYLQVTTSDIGGVRGTTQIHLAVGHAFVEGRTPERWQVNHKDGVKTNNVWTNLEWVSPLENNHHAMRIGLYKSLGERHPRATLSEDTVRAIATAFKAGQRPYHIAKDFGLSSGTVHSVIAGRSWKHVTGFALCLKNTTAGILPLTQSEA